MADISTPSGMGGLLRYNEEYKSRFQIKPEYVIIAIAAVIIGMAILKILTA